MKTLLLSAVFSASAAILAVPAAAQVAPGIAGAVAHFNAGKDRVSDQTVLLPGRLDMASMSTRGGLTVAQIEALENHNASQDSSGDRIDAKIGRGQNFSTLSEMLSPAQVRAIAIHNASQDSAGDRIVLR
jgi:hypothetical protein